MKNYERPKSPLSFSAVKIALASPEKIKEWSHGEVKKPETINYRTFKPERDGLFCARIFGPIKDYECNCGKYKRMKHRGITCEKCGVEVIKSQVRRERMGHIDLAAPVAHIWFLKSIPSRIGSLLDLTLKDLEKILYYEAYILVDAGNTDMETGELINEDTYRKLVAEDYSFKAGMGAETIKEMMASLDMEELSKSLRKELNDTKSEAKRTKLGKRLKVVEAFRKSGNRPEWMILENIPVIPPDLRPLVPLDGGRFATSDMNDLYRRVINRNNRLKRLIELNAPDIIIRNEKRMLQESVDALFDNGKRGRAISGPDKRPLKSLSDMLRGKQGRFRQNLLGKRVDYSGRSVIVVGPELRLHQCGLPKKMALELFKPFIYHKMEERGLVNSIKSAKKMVEKEMSEVWDILEEVIREHPVMLNRAPTLHRLGIQAFEPVLIEGKAIQLHPLVCAAFNADFDGDQMAVHVPLSLESQVENRVLIMSTNNILSPAHGKPIIVPSQDMVLGIYYMTRTRPAAPGTGKAFSSPEEVKMAMDQGHADIHAKIKVRLDGKLVETTPGRIILWEILPRSVPFSTVNKVMKKKELEDLINTCFRVAGNKETVILADKVRTLGFDYATSAGISISVDDLQVPSRKAELLDQAYQVVQEIEEEYQDGRISPGERYNKVVDRWGEVTNAVAEELTRELGRETIRDAEGNEFESESLNPIYMMVDSGARGSQQQVRQLAGMRGLMAKPSGEIIETPITANFREGLSVLQYFVSTHGARKGLADTALKTANSGYLTRRLVDVSQDCIVTEEDCGTIDGIEVSALLEAGRIIEPVGGRILGRTVLEDVQDRLGNVLVQKNEIIDEEGSERIDEAGQERVKIRSVLTCKARRGVCRECYGRDLARGHKVNVGEAVGVIAAQSIGEPGTQLTMRTFHIGGAASSRGEQSSHVARSTGKVRFENLSTIRKKDGTLVALNRHGSIIIEDDKGMEVERLPIVYGAEIKVAEGDKVKPRQLIAEWDPYSNPILTEMEGRIKFGDIIENATMIEQVDDRTGFARKVIIPSKNPDLRPRISLKEPEGGKTLKLPGSNQFARYFMPVGAHVMVQEGDMVYGGDVIAKIPRETTKTKDITGGLPRVAELFEARKPKELAVISDVDGFVSFGEEAKGKRTIIVTPEVGEPKSYQIPKGKAIIVHEGDYIRAGEPLVEGSANPHDILRVRQEKELAKYLVNEIQQVYRLQGVKIDDKHIEVIVRQMLRRVRITEPGDSEFLAGDEVDRATFEDENEAIIAKKGKPATAEPKLLGITKASLSTESFISAASFQETTRVLTDASIAGRIDFLRGLKENVIMGRLIPAGTGIEKYWKMGIEIPDLEEKIAELDSA
ncbi:MAG: DNA-directed RNA polymerase subunit beta' [bacterium]